MLFDLPHLQNRRSPLGPIKSPVTLLVGPPSPTGRVVILSWGASRLLLQSSAFPALRHFNRKQNSNVTFWKSIVGRKRLMDFPVLASTFAAVLTVAHGSDDTQQSRVCHFHTCVRS